MIGISLTGFDILMFIPDSLLCLLAASLLQGQGPRPRDGDLRVGIAAPDVKLLELAGKKHVRVGELKGKPVVLIFGSCT